MKRYYKLVYWYHTTKISVTDSFKNKNEAYEFIYSGNNMPVSVTYIGWK